MTISSLESAISDFHRARNQAVMKEIMSRFTGEDTRLLSFEEVRRMLKAQSSSDRGLQDVPLDAIVGSVNRYEDFTRDFLPRGSVDAERWARVEMAVSDLKGLEPVELYKIGDVYFVKDGNHRVSVAQQMGSAFIQAYVTEVRTRVTLAPDIKPEELILKAEYAEFLEKTKLDEIRPEADLTVTVPGQYQMLEEHISVHRYYMGIEQQREILYPEAVAHWYDTVYLPIRQIIWAKGILKAFPNRTEADLYLWISEHRAFLEEEVGMSIRPEKAAGDLADKFSEKPERLVSRLGSKLLFNLLPSQLETGPGVGEWRKEKQAEEQNYLFSDILVPVSGRENAWAALEHALEVARREQGVLYGLHVIGEDTTQEQLQNVEHEFMRRCQEGGVPGKLLFSEGEIVRRICEQARWNDLVVINLAYPPAPQPLAALSSGFRMLIQRCPRPLLAVPQGSQLRPFQNALLAYDGSPKAEEALFIATYLAGQWQLSLTVLTVFEEGRIPPETLLKAALYLEQHEMEARFIKETGPAAGMIVRFAEENEIDLLLMGGYGSNPMIDVVLGSTVDKVLRDSRKPMLICR